MPRGEIKRILMVCHGNICRSPFAEQALASLRPDLEVRSAGLEAGEGSPADPVARQVARRFSVSLDDHKAHRLESADLEWADLILGMEGHHAAEILRQWPRALERTRLLGDYLESAPHLLEDPYGRGEEIFGDVFHRIASAVGHLSRIHPSSSGT